jgi:predicted TPR repeat methyltransferase
MQQLDDVLREAMLAHRAGRLAAAEVGYHRVLKQRPGDARALHFLGLLTFHQGDLEGGIRLLTQSIESEPLNARVWNALGSMFIAADKPEEARRAYQQSTEVAPDVAEGWYNLAICLRNEGDVDGALTRLRESLRCDPDYSRAYEALAMLLYQLGRQAEAARVYGDWIQRDPSSTTARYMAAATSGENVPARAPDDYVRDLFDQTAAAFDMKLEQLRYRAPALIADALVRHAQQTSLASVLDAGCGTGLCGPLLRPLCRRLVGIDLSPNMIERARGRAAYDELITAELSAFMRANPDSFDAVISADTLVYFGSLEDPLSAAHEALRVGGRLVFTLEALPEGETGHRLQFHGRYAHSEGYVRDALAAAGLAIESLSREILRQEAEQDVAGFLVVAHAR